ncbi:MAG: GatB/YqeY domain-containing protein [Alphaproteobacteria bacterium]|nr:MAG: GatB/YqeY domain-containing protein [Alphaproteobacteria bacterium]
MRQEINQALKEAMKERDKIRTATLRLITAAIKDRDIAARSEDRDGVSDDEILQILQKMVKQRRESSKTYEEAGRQELADQELAEIDVIEGFLPQQMSDEEVAAAAKAVVEEIGAEGLKDMGRTMGALKERYAGVMDFGKANKVVKDLLS